MVIFGRYTRKKFPTRVSLNQAKAIESTRIIDLAALTAVNPHMTEVLHEIMGGPFAVVSCFRHSLYYVIVPSPSSGDRNDHHHADSREPH